MHPMVLISPDLKLPMEDYQWLSVIGLTMTLKDHNFYKKQEDKI